MGDDVHSTINPSATRLIGYPALTSFAPADLEKGTVSDLELARIFSSGDERATIRITADPRHRLDPPTADRIRGRFSQESKSAPTAGEMEQDIRSIIRDLPGAEEQTMIDQILANVTTAFAPVIQENGRTPEILRQIQRVLTTVAGPQVEDREWPSYK